MSAYYDLYQTPDPLGENRNEPRLHARILPRGTISADKFRELVAKATGFSPAILDGTLQAVTDELYSWLSEGWTVEVGELGYFSVSLKCDRQVTDKKEIRSPSVHFQNVNLRLGSKFRNRFNTMELERKASCWISHRYPKRILTDRIGKSNVTSCRKEGWLCREVNSTFLPPFFKLNIS